MITVTIGSSVFEKKLGRVLKASRNPGEVLMGAGRALSVMLVKHFRQKNWDEPNKLGAPRSDFWLAVSRAVHQPEQTGYNSISVAVSHPAIAQKVFGGPIRAKEAKYLTIPVERRAYGKTADSFEAETGLKLRLIRQGKGAFQKLLLAAEESGKLTVEYVLKKQVNQLPDPTALPPKSAMMEAVLAAAQEEMENQLRDVTT